MIILKGDFSDSNNYLNKNFRNVGSLTNSSDLLKSASGEESINPEVFIKYLENKYLIVNKVSPRRSIRH